MIFVQSLVASFTGSTDASIPLWVLIAIHKNSNMQPWTESFLSRDTWQSTFK